MGRTYTVKLDNTKQSDSQMKKILRKTHEYLIDSSNDLIEQLNGINK